MSQNSLIITLGKILINRYGYNKHQIVQTKNFLIAEGEIPVALVAHLDTVFSHSPEEIYYDNKAKVMWSPQGLGADDRAGVYSIIEILELGYRPHIIFTTEEEQGCLGTQIMLSKIPDPPFELKYIIQLDRQGENDSVFYDCNNPEFEQYINNFGFKTARGSFSDISFIAPQWGVAAVNLSIGYEDEHFEIERLFIFAMQKTILKVCKMLDDVDNAYSFAYIPKKREYLQSFQKEVCDWCGEPIVGIKNSVHLCKNCYDAFQNYVGWR